MRRLLAARKRKSERAAMVTARGGLALGPIGTPAVRSGELGTLRNPRLLAALKGKNERAAKVAAECGLALAPMGTPAVLSPEFGTLRHPCFIVSELSQRNRTFVSA